jgi:hypothetical protein
MNETSLRVMQLVGQGFCCSQILLILGLEAQGQQNPALVRAANGLCKGFGSRDEVCGALSGGACLLALYAGKGAPGEERHDRYELLLSSMVDWFRETVRAQYGGITCDHIVGKGLPAPDPTRCGPLVVQTFERAMALLLENGIDPTQAREDEAV